MKLQAVHYRFSTFLLYLLHKLSIMLKIQLLVTVKEYQSSYSIEQFQQLHLLKWKKFIRNIPAPSKRQYEIQLTSEFEIGKKRMRWKCL